VLVAGPNLLACYGSDPDKPLWEPKFSTIPLATGLTLATAPRPFAPAVDGGRIYTRWGVRTAAAGRNARETYRYLKDVAAFSLRDGKLLWSTSAESAWEDFWPISDPVCADGRLYLLAVKHVTGDEPQPLALACLDPTTGALLWRRELGAAARLIGSLAVKGRRLPTEAVDLLRYSPGVTVVAGAVYFGVGGLLFRCDARDGQPEWVRTYPREVADDKLLTLCARHGAPPLPAGKRVVFLPRDARRLIAVDAASGELAWEQRDRDYRQLLGLAGGNLLLAEEQRIEAVAASTGKLGWDSKFDLVLDGRARLEGNSVIVSGRKSVYRVNAETGRTDETRDWGGDRPLSVWVRRGKTLVGLREAAKD
jgi:outer membrane protein assembly factor BamB